MLSLNLRVIGLLILCQYTHSFVLLTANIEDVKQIAKRFISDALATRIAEFLAQATGQSVPDVSEENEKNAKDIQDISDGDTYQFKKVARQITTRAQPDTFNIKNIESIVPEQTQHQQREPEAEPKPKRPKQILRKKKLKPKIMSEESRVQMHRPLNRFKNVKNRPRKRKTEEQMKRESFGKIRKRPKQPPQDEPLGEHEARDFHVNIHAEDDIIPPPDNREDPQDNTQKYRVKEMKRRLKKKKIKHRTEERYALLSNNGTDAADIGQTIMDVSKADESKVLRSNMELTTEKQKEEFDQYDNPQAHTGQSSPSSSGPFVPRASEGQKQELMTRIEVENPNVDGREQGKENNVLQDSNNAVE